MKAKIAQLLSSEPVRRIQASSWIVSRYVWRRKGLWLRALLCWLLGMGFLLADHDVDYDLRLKIRGPQKTDNEIVLLIIDRDDWGHWIQSRPENFNIVHDYSYFSFNDSYYWNLTAWHSLLDQLLANHPRTVGVTTFFGENIPEPEIAKAKDAVFADKRIVWAAQLNADGHVLPSRFARAHTKNSGLSEFIADRDGVIRRFNHSTNLQHLASQLASRMGTDHDDLAFSETSAQLINYRGETGTFRTLTFKDFLARNYPPHFFLNKTVIVGTAEPEGGELRTPVGPMSRAEVVANLVDNIHNRRWVEKPALWLEALLMLLLVVAIAACAANYPQFLALFIIIWANFVLTTVSLWIFDAFYYWLPVLASMIVSITTYVIFLSFQLTLKEYLTGQLEKERQFLIDVEELKNNFLSLISHDLKTPIAKIQAICDRLIAQYPHHEFTSDIQSLREVGTELHRYIRTILQITRVESRNFTLANDSVDINEIIELVVQQLDTLVQAKAITIELRLEPIFLVEMDQVLIHEVVLNLIENAIKYTPEKGRIIVSSREVDGQVFFMVEDNGPGIPDSEQIHIFEKFYRGELGRSQPRGSGLGLYLVKYFVEIHSGKVFLESTVGQGTRVGFTLPIEQPNATTGLPESLVAPVTAIPKAQGDIHEAQT